MSLWLLFPLFVLAMIALVVRRGLQMRKLCDAGVPSKAKVTRIRHRPGGASGASQRQLTYQFHDETGGVFSHTSAVSQSFAAEHPVGSVIDIAYLPSNPKVSAPAFLVEQCLQALAKKR